MARRSKKSSKQKHRQEEEPEDLDRFAGSSEDEGEAEPSVPSRKEYGDEKPTATARVEASVEEEDDDDDSSIEEYSKYSQIKVADDADEQAGALGMANAMSRILGGSLPKGKGTSTVILSRTVTPLQRAARTEKQKEQEQREKRKANRERNLAALHVPLSVATTVATSAGSSSTLLGKELEAERLHRRVATRGVVALFNAIAQHQKKTDVTTTATTTTQSKKADVQHMTKHGFLDMIKKSAAGGPSPSPEDKPRDNIRTSSLNGQAATKQQASKPKWNALQDDYMLNSKLKDWDKESSDEDSSNPPIPENDADDWSDPEAENKESVDPPAAKKRRLTAH